MDARTEAPVFRVETIDLDLPALTGAFSQRLRRAGLTVTAERAASFAHALTLVRPTTRRRLYWTARAVFVSDEAQVKAFDAVFVSVFERRGDGQDLERALADVRTLPAPRDEWPLADREPVRSSDLANRPEDSARDASCVDGEARAQDEILVPMAPSEEEVLRHKRFDTLSAHELAALYQLMSRLVLATPLRRTRRAERYRHGQRIDLRRTLRGSMRTGAEPIRLGRRRRRVVPRRMVLLCDISGSMEPYARAYLQFLACAARSARNAEVFVFATRLTRVTRALASRNPERAIQGAAAAAPDWSSGTRIGDALKTFNDHHGRRGMARGAVIVILSDGWERGDPALVGREVERLARLAYRIVWVNPRAGADGFVPRAGGMVAALPYCDALVSGHNLQALGQVLDAIGVARSGRLEGSGNLSHLAQAEPDDEPWASATPVPGSSVAMPSGYGPSRGHTTPGWGLGGS